MGQPCRRDWDQIRRGRTVPAGHGPGLPASSSYEFELNGIICRVDKTLVIVASLVAATVPVAFAAWAVSWYRQRRILERAKMWPASEATVQAGAFEGTRESGKLVLPTFTFSYQVSGEYYSGRFCLLPERTFFPEPFIPSITTRLVGRRLLLRHDPNRPEVWFIADETIEGYRVGQKIGMHVVHSYYPKD